MAHLPIADKGALDAVTDELAVAAAVMGFEANSLKIMAHRPEILRGFWPCQHRYWGLTPS